jgi:hypothetical protein
MVIAVIQITINALLGERRGRNLGISTGALVVVLMSFMRFRLSEAH